MSTIIINASPNGAKGNTEWSIKQFQSGTISSCEVRYVSKESFVELAEYIMKFDTILIFLPLYIHAMPGILRKLMEQMKATQRGQSIGFVVQAGFEEGQQSQYLETCFRLFAKRLGYQYLGTVRKGDCAGITMMPMPNVMTQKLRKKLSDLGKDFEKTGEFQSDILEQFLEPYELSDKQMKKMEFITKIGLNEYVWNRMLKKAGTLEQRRDCPYL